MFRTNPECQLADTDLEVVADFTGFTAEDIREAVYFAVVVHGWRPARKAPPAAENFDEHEAPTARLRSEFLAATAMAVCV